MKMMMIMREPPPSKPCEKVVDEERGKQENAKADLVRTWQLGQQWQLEKKMRLNEAQSEDKFNRRTKEKVVEHLVVKVGDDQDKVGIDIKSWEDNVDYADEDAVK